ncbi:unnamed protein product, partial [Ixodes persulcatus]
AFSETRNCGRRHVENTVSARIINGTEAEPGSWPWMVGLYNENDTLYCGGVLISDRFVLTAAHCLPYVHNSSVSASPRGSKTSSANVDGDESVRCGHLQPYVPASIEDIAIVKLKRPVNFTDHIQPICLPENCDEPSLSAATYMAGWGLDYVGFVISNSPSTLRQRYITFIHKTACQNQLKRTVPDYIQCSAGGTCRGDSGGPLVYENNGTWFLVGIHSGGDKNCYFQETPGLHIKVSYYV